MTESTLSKTCPVCKTVFFKKNIRCSQSQWDARVCCSHKCAGLKFPLEEYKLKRANDLLSNTTTTERGCMEYQGATSRSGYGYATVFNKTNNAHRHIYELLYGDIPHNIFVCHKCDNRKCINPAHLFLGTNQDNMNDCKNKGRQAKGKAKPNTKINHGDIQDIYVMADKGINYTEIGKIFNIGRRHIGRILNGWRPSGYSETNALMLLSGHETGK